MTNRGPLLVIENYVPIGSAWKMKKHLHLSEGSWITFCRSRSHRFLRVSRSIQPGDNVVLSKWTRGILHLPLVDFSSLSVQKKVIICSTVVHEIEHTNAWKCILKIYLYKPDNCTNGPYFVQKRKKKISVVLF